MGDGGEVKVLLSEDVRRRISGPGFGFACYAGFIGSQWIVDGDLAKIR